MKRVEFSSVLQIRLDPGVSVLENTFPPPPGEYQPVSFGGKKYEKGKRKRRERGKKKEEGGKEKRKWDAKG
jgi:hypothetical protein